MGRQPLIRTSNFPYHVTVRSNNRDWFYLPIDHVWSIFNAYLFKTQEQFNVEIHAFVLMSNHIHLLLTTPGANLDVAMKYFLRESCRSVNRTAGRINHLFGGPYKWSLIGDPVYYRHAYKYVYRNPVKAGVCSRIENYPFSTRGKGPTLVIMTPSRFDAALPESRLLEWLNVGYSKEEDDCVRRALRRREFKFAPDRQSHKLPSLFAGCVAK